MDHEFTKPPYYMVYAPIGGFGNHIRWLCLLDSSYILEDLKGTSGPLVTLDDKLEFITNTVYNNNRTYNNWLKYEFEWREKLNDHLKFTHDMVDFFDNLKAIAVKIDPELAYNAYVKFNDKLNGISRESFLQQIKKQNSVCDFMGQYLKDLVLPIDSGVLFQSILDIDFYNQVLKHFNLKNYYSEAQQIHKIWYDLHTKADYEWLQNKNIHNPY